MNFDIPDSLKNVVSCYISAPIKYGNVDLAVCTTEGYILEISRKMIVNNCHTGVKHAVDACIYYQYQDDGDFKIFFIIRNKNGDFAIIAKEEENLKVIDSRSGVQNFRIADLEISGNPKLLIYSGPNDYQVFGNQDQEMFEISESQPENESVVNCIPIALQDLQNQHDELEKELMFKKALIRRRLVGSKDEANLALIGNKLDSSEWMDISEPKPLLTIVETWERITGNFWVCALRVKNSSDKAIGKISVVCTSSLIREYQWMVYQEDLVDSSISAAANGLIIIAAVVPDIGEIGKIRNRFEIRYSDVVFVSPEFQLTSKDVISGDLELFHSGNFAQDLACVRLTHLHCELTISLAITPAHSFTDTLKTDLNLTQVSQFSTPDCSYFTTRSPQLTGLLIQLEKLSQNQFHFKIHTRTQEQLFLFVSALKEIAPYGSKIQLTE